MQQLDAEIRRRILQEYWQVHPNWAKLQNHFYPPEYSQRRQELTRQYCDGLPIVPLSRCPYCETIIQIVMDTFDIDGLALCLNHAEPRHIKCPHFWMLSGALRLGQSITVSKGGLETGPELPFIIPQVLNDHPIKVVIFQVPVGQHVAYPTAYFTEKKPVFVKKPFPEWTTGIYRWTKNGRIQQLGMYDAIPSEYKPLKIDADFDLAPWIEQGKVLWIAPDDESMTLRSDVEGYPYLNLPGTKEFLWVIRGQVRYSPNYGRQGIYRED